MRDALAAGRMSTPIQAELQQIVPIFLAQVEWAQKTGDISQIQGALAQISQPLLDQLAISPNETDMKEIMQRLLAYAADARADVRKLQAGDRSSSALAAKALSIPKRKLTWEQMLQIICGSFGVALANAATTYTGAIIQCDDDEIFYDNSVEEVHMDND